MNALFSIIDKRSDRYRNVLERSEKVFGFPISDYTQGKDYIKKIRIYRNQRSAHFGENYFSTSSSIEYDIPIIMIEHLRQDRNSFNEKYLRLTDESYGELKFYFVEKIPDIARMLNEHLNEKQIEKELTDYLDNVMENEFVDK